MKEYQLYFFILKIIVILQAFLVYLKKETKDSKVYLITDTILKFSLAVYLFIFPYVHSIVTLPFEDIAILRFSAGVMLLDIDFVKLADLFFGNSSWVSDKLKSLYAIQ